MKKNKSFGRRDNVTNSDKDAKIYSYQGKDIKIFESKMQPYNSVREFLDFWQEIHDIWRVNNSLDYLSNIEGKIKLRKSLIKKFGIKH